MEDQIIKMREREHDYYAPSYKPVKERIWKRIILSCSDVITESRQTDEYITAAYLRLDGHYIVDINADNPLKHYTWRTES